MILLVRQRFNVVEAQQVDRAGCKIEAYPHRCAAGEERVRRAARLQRRIIHDAHDLRETRPISGRRALVIYRRLTGG
jgi:hypothetical protein